MFFPDDGDGGNDDDDDDDANEGANFSMSLVTWIS